MPPAVSVIIPTYNRWPMIGEAVESVLRQSFKEFELIVVDDGSSDDTPEKLKGFGCDVRMIMQARRGVSAARNKGASAASGDYLAFLDSDDLWLPKKLAVQIAFMQSHPEVKICQTEEIWLRRGKRVNPKVRHRKPSGDVFRASLELCLVSPSAAMMTKELFEEMGGFDESLPVCEDYDLWLRIAAEHPVSLIPNPLVIKRGGHSDQLSHSIWGMDRYRVEALRKLLRSGLGGERRTWAIDVLRRKVALLAQGARKRGKERESRAYELVLSEFLQENLDARSQDPRVREDQGVSPPDRGALVEFSSGG